MYTKTVSSKDHPLLLISTMALAWARLQVQECMQIKQNIVMLGIHERCNIRVPWPVLNQRWDLSNIGFHLIRTFIGFASYLIWIQRNTIRLASFCSHLNMTGEQHSPVERRVLLSCHVLPWLLVLLGPRPVGYWIYGSFLCKTALRRMPNCLSLICCPGLLPHPQLKSNLTVLRGPQELSHNSFMSADAKDANQSMAILVAQILHCSQQNSS